MSRSPGGGDGQTIVVDLEGGRSGVAGTVDDLSVEPAVVEPVDVAQGDVGAKTNELLAG